MPSPSMNEDGNGGDDNDDDDDDDDGDDDDDDDDWKIRKYWWSRYQSRRSGSVADIAAASATYTTHTHKYCI